MSTTTKTFPKSRVCVVDIYPSFEQGLKKAVEFALKHDIQLSSADGHKVIIGFCLEYIEEAYKAVHSSFPKVLCIGSKPRNASVDSFITKHFDKIIKLLPLPYCGRVLMTSPDLETAANNATKQYKPQRKFEKVAKMLRLKKTANTGDSKTSKFAEDEAAREKKQFEEYKEWLNKPSSNKVS